MEVRYLMNKKEELKAPIIKSCVEDNMTVKQASNSLGFSELELLDRRNKVVVII